jgi:hypothetical protein
MAMNVLEVMKSLLAELEGALQAMGVDDVPEAVTMAHMLIKFIRWVVERMQTIADKVRARTLPSTQTLTGGGIPSLAQAGGGTLNITQTLTGGGTPSLAKGGGG